MEDHDPEIVMNPDAANACASRFSGTNLISSARVGALKHRRRGVKARRGELAAVADEAALRAFW